MLKTKLHRFLSQQHKKKQQRTNLLTTDKRSKSTTLGSRSAAVAPPNTKDKQVHMHSSASRTHGNSRAESSKRDFSHRMTHYQNQQITKPKTMATNETPTDVVAETSERNDTYQVEIEDKTVSHTSTLNSFAQPKEYSNLKKLTMRNDHTTKVRKIQNAAIKIQRAWRKHQYQAKR